MNLILKIGTAKVKKDANLRKDQPSTLSVISGKILAGAIIKFVGYVSDGENISGNTKWYKTDDGNYIWSGNMEEISESFPSVQPGSYPAITASQLSDILPNLKSRIDEFVIALNGAMQEFSINTPIRQAAFIAQTAHESIGYTCMIENLNYSAQALQSTWPARFPVAIATQVARQPEKIGNITYANRLGNGDEKSGDGWRYRGRGIMQVTGRGNYKECGAALGLDLVSSPELLEQPINAFRSAGWYWKSRNLNQFAESGDFKELTRRINGGYNGLDDRMKYYSLAKTALGIV